MHMRSYETRGRTPAILADDGTTTTRVPHPSIHRVKADGVTVFYRQAVSAADAPVALLLHGFPTSSVFCKGGWLKLAGKQ